MIRMFTAVLLSACLLGKPFAAIAGERMDTLVSAEWLAENINAEDLVVIDSTVRVLFAEDGTMSNESGLSSYKAAHIPKARFADLLIDMSAPGQELAMPSPERFAAALGALGIKNTDRVVIYSTDYFVWATRLWWMMRWIGHDQVAVLDGGMRAWEEAGLHVTGESIPIAATTYSVHLRPELISDQADVISAIANKDTMIIDALSPSHYRGEVTMYQRAGHISTALNVPTNELTDGEGRLRPDDELELLIGAPAGTDIITYCGGGVAATGPAFAAFRAGVKNVSVYAGSLEEWTSNPDNPMTLGEE